jgi:hypothetical protein
MNDDLTDHMARNQEPAHSDDVSPLEAILKQEAVAWEGVRRASIPELTDDLTVRTGVLFGRPFGTPLVWKTTDTWLLPGSIFHLILGFAADRECVAQLHIGAVPYGDPLELGPGRRAAPALCVGSSGYAVPATTYHEVWLTLTGVPEDAIVIAIGVRVSSDAVRQLRRPMWIPGVVSFVEGQARPHDAPLPVLRPTTNVKHDDEVLPPGGSAGL